METIQAIREVNGVPDPTSNRAGYWSTFSGYEITTDKQRVYLLIGDQQNCCESWGYFMSNDNLDEFVGAELREVKIVDDALNTRVVADNMPSWGLDFGDVMFVNLETSAGTLQFAAYNAHNGYYSHSAIVRSAQLTEDISL
jgi:hypothetical protein